MNRILSAVALTLTLLSSAHADPLFGGAPGVGENDPGRLPSGSGSCSSCDIDPAERLPRWQPEPQTPEPQTPEPQTTPEPPEHDVGGAGGGQPGYLE